MPSVFTVGATHEMAAVPAVPSGAAGEGAPPVGTGSAAVGPVPEPGPVPEGAAAAE